MSVNEHVRAVYSDMTVDLHRLNTGGIFNVLQRIPRLLKDNKDYIIRTHETSTLTKLNQLETGLKISSDPKHAEGFRGPRFY